MRNRGICLLIGLAVLSSARPALAEWAVASAPPPTTVYCDFPAPTPQIDGDLKDWPAQRFVVKLNQAQLGERVFYNPPISGGDKDCSGEVALTWDGKFLYVAVKARDDILSPVGDKGWGAPWGHDGLMLYLHAHSGLELSGRYGKEWRRDSIDSSALLGINYYGAGEKPRALPGATRYTARAVPGGYQIEAAVDLQALGYLDPRPGDRLKMALILVDVDPGAAPADAFGQLVAYLPKSGEGGSSSWADLRLLKAGWGGEIVAVGQPGERGPVIGVKTTIDALRDDVIFRGVRVKDEKGSVVLTAAAQTPVQRGERLTAATVLDTAALPEGVYSVHLVAQVAGTEHNGDAVAPVTLRRGALPVEYPKVVAVEDPARFQWRQLPPTTKTVNRDTYLAFVQQYARPKLAAYRQTFNNPWRFAHDYGWLAAYLYLVTRDPFYADAAKAALESAMRYAESQDKEFDLHIATHYMMVKFMREAGLITAEMEPRVKAYLVKTSRFACYGHYDWEANPWRRGAGHSGLGPAVARYFALRFYPEALTDEEKATFQKYYDLTWNDWWEHRDTIYNDTGYRAGFLREIFLAAYLLDREDLFKDPEAMKFWERLLYTSPPCGAYPHYGDTNGWSTMIGLYAFFFEYIAAKTGDGRFRTGAQRLFDYIVNHTVDVADYHFESDPMVQGVALAHMVADDKVKPAPLGGGSRVLSRKEVVPMKDTKLDFGWDVYGMRNGPQEIPDKIIFATDERPESLWAMIELCPNASHNDVPEPGNVAALMDYEAVLTCNQGYFDETPDLHNVVFAEDLEGLTAAGAEMKISLPQFYDRKQASYARVRMDNYQGWPLHNERQFLFARGRFLLLKDNLEFTAPWMCRVGPAWQTQNVAPEIGESWANTYVSSLFTTGLGLGRGFQRWKNPPQDLIVFHPPQKEYYLEIVNRFDEQPYRQLPVRLRYVWKGMARAGDRLHFTTLLLPHVPIPKPSELVQKIEVLADTREVTALRLNTQDKREEWVLLNDSGKPFSGGGLESDAKQLYLYVDTGKQPAKYVLAEGATYVRLNGQALTVPAQAGRIEGEF